MSPRLNAPNLQLNELGKLKHFLSLDGLKQQHLLEILDLGNPLLTRKPTKSKKSRCCAAKRL